MRNRRAAFGSAGDVVLPAPDQEGLAGPGAGCQHRDWGMGQGAAGIYLGRLPGLQMRHRVGDRFQVVGEGDVIQPDVMTQRRFFQIPRQDGQVGAARDHRASHIEAGGVGPFAAAGQEGLDDRLQPFEVGAVELLFRHEPPRAGLIAKPPVCAVGGERPDAAMAASYPACVVRTRRPDDRGGLENDTCAAPQAASPSLIDCSSRERFAVTSG
jgi:hypothetical protein